MIERTGLAQSILLKLIRKLYRLVKWLIAIGMLVLIFAIIITLSPYGQQKLGKIIGSVISNIGEGECKIGGVKLYQIPRITIYDVDWKYQEKSVIKLKEIDLKVNLLKLLGRRINLQYLKLKGLEVQLEETPTGWNIQKLLSQSEKRGRDKEIVKEEKPKKKKESFIKRVSVDQILIADATIECITRNEKLSFSKSPLLIEGKNFVYEDNRISTQAFTLISNLVHLNIEGIIHFQKPLPLGSYKLVLVIPDSTTKRLLPTLSDRADLIVKMNGESASKGLKTDIECSFPNQVIKASFFSSDPKFSIIQFQAEIGNINLAKFIEGVDSTSINSFIQGTLFDLFSNPRSIAKVGINQTQIPPLKNLQAELELNIGNSTIELEGKVSEEHLNSYIKLNTKNLLKPNTTADLTLSGTVRNLRQFISTKDIQDSINVQINLKAKGNKIPIDSILFQLATNNNRYQEILVDSFIVNGSFNKNLIQIHSLIGMVANGKVYAAGMIQFSNKPYVELKGSVNKITLSEFRKFLKQDSLQGQLNLDYDFQLAVNDSNQYLPQISANGWVTNFKNEYASADTIKLKRVTVAGSLEKVEVGVEIDSLRTQYLAPQKVELSASRDKSKLALLVNSYLDTAFVQCKLNANYDEKLNRLEIIPDTLIYSSNSLPIYLVYSEPIYIDNKNISCNQFAFDTPFGILKTKLNYDVAGKLTSEFFIDDVQLTSLLVIQPILQHLNGVTSLQGKIEYSPSLGINSDLNLQIQDIYWDDLFVSDSLSIVGNLRDSVVMWNLNAYREDTRIMNSLGKVQLQPNNQFQIHQVKLETIEMPSRWFTALLPNRSIWDGTIKIDLEQMNNQEPKTNVRLSANRLSLPEYGIDQKDMVIRISSIGEKLILDTAYSKAGRGDIKILGNVFTKTFLPDSFDLIAKARRFRFVKMANRELMGDLDLAINGKLMNLNLNGRVQLLEAKYGFGEETKELEEVYLEEDYTPMFPANELWKNTSGIVTISAPGNVWVTGNGINAETKMNLTMNKLVNEQYPQLFGTVEIIRGTVTQYGRKLKIQEGYFVFDGDPFDPKISIKATEETLQRTMNVKISLELSGSAQKPTIQLRGYYPNGTMMTELDVVSYLVVGRPTASLLTESSDNESFTERATETATATATAQITSLLGRKLGLSIFEYRPSDNSNFQKVGGELEVGGYITDRIFLSAVTPMGSASLIDRIRAEYQVRPWLRISVSREADGRQSLESYIQTEWGMPRKPKSEKMESETGDREKE